MAANNRWTINELEALGSDQLFNIIDFIPSDGESDVSDGDSDDDGETTNVEPMEVEVLLDAENFVAENMIENEMEWDSEDDLPLSAFCNPCNNNDARSRQEKKKPDEVVEWSNNLQKYIAPSVFVDEVGPDVPDEIENPLDIYLLLLSEELLNVLVFQTNLYAIQKNHANARTFVPTTLDEIKCFLGTNILMGIKKVPSYKDYWSSRTELRDNFISSTMSRNRFSWLLGHLHLNDNSVQSKKGEEGYDKLYKLRPMLDKLSENFHKYYKPSKCQSVDESMIRFKGRSSLRQYMPKKPIKRGYKMWVRANESGFISQFQIYTGKAKEVAEKNLGGRVVKDLTNNLSGKCHEVYMDNFFTSYLLLKDLRSRYIYGCGTIKQNAKFQPKDFPEDKNMQRGDSVWKISNDHLVSVKWMDNRGVRFLSNFHNPEDIQVISRKQKDGTLENFTCLKLVKDYNKHMGYVDKSDMLKSCYEVDRKSKKWWHRIFWHFIDLTLVNAFIIFKERAGDAGKSFKLKQFRLAVAVGLIGADPETPQRGRRSAETVQNKFKMHVPIERRIDKAAHMPLHGNKVRCAHCSTRQNPHRTRWHCTICNVGLCLTDKQNCFILFHKK